jgi:hypothetical protein
MTEPIRGIRHRFVDAVLVRSVESHTWTARINEPRDALPKAAGNDVVCAERIDAVEMIPRAPNACDTRGVKDDINALTSSRNRFRIAQVAGDCLDAKPVQLRIATSGESSHSVAASDQLLGDVLTKEPAGACNQSEQYLISELCNRIFGERGTFDPLTGSNVATFGVLISPARLLPAAPPR